MRRRFFVEQFTGQSAVIEGETAHHLGRVLRAQPGQFYELSDGSRVRLGRIEGVARDRIEFALLEEVPSSPPAVDITLLLSIVKFEAFEWALEKATELGVGMVVPVAAARSEKAQLAAAENRAERWRKILKGPWRFGFDESHERPQVREVMKMLRDGGMRPERIRPYVMIGDEPYEDCMQRIYDVLAWKGQPHVQYKIKLNALTKEPQVRFDWTVRKLKDVARWANRRIWRYAPRFEEYKGAIKSNRVDRYDPQTGLFT